MCKLYCVIEELCAKNNISITQMCKESGASRASLTDLKKGRKQSLSTETLLKIAGYFDVSIDYLLGNTDQKEKAPAKAEADDVTFDDFTYAMYHESRELDNEDKQALLNIARLLKKKIKEKE